jgi:hypothetical protein
VNGDDETLSVADSTEPDPPLYVVLISLLGVIAAVGYIGWALWAVTR